MHSKGRWGQCLEKGDYETELVREQELGGETRGTYTLRNLNMLDKHSHLLLGDKALEAVPRLGGVILEDDGLGAIPTDTIGERKQVFHQSRLAGQFKFDRSIAKTRKAAVGEALLVSLNGTDGSLHAHKLHVRIIRLARNTFHNDVNGLLAVVENLGVTAKKSENLSALGSERNLKDACQHGD